MVVKKTIRKQLGKKIRFEVFKRDSFKCQYCGASAPEVVLHIDHIVPVASGGKNDLTNLITACSSCNLGKGAKSLDDNTAVVKSRIQLEELQERREQLEMIMKWKEELRNLDQDVLNRLCKYWEKHAPGFSINNNGKKNIKKMLREFSIDEITSAMDIAAESYLEFDKEIVTSDSWEIAFSKISAICRVNRDCKDDPDLKDLYYIRGIVRNRCSYFKNQLALDWLKAARSWGVEIDELREIASRCTSWTDFSDKIDEAIEYQKELEKDAEEAMNCKNQGDDV